MRSTALFATFAVLFSLLNASPAAALDETHWQEANQAIERGVEYLRSTQNEDGSWIPEPGPAITGLCLAALLDQPDIGPDDPAVVKAIDFILAHIQEDGSIRQGPDGILASYNTSICLSAMSRIGNDPRIAQAIAMGQDFLRSIQWKTGMLDPNDESIDDEHPYVGGFGYGRHGRPDLSNTQIALQALHDTGCDCDDPAFQRALIFLNRVQATPDNDLYADMIQQDEDSAGGFIYAPSTNSDNINTPQSMANPDQVEQAREGNAVSGLRTYGGMTYSGFKSLLYANLDRDDPRVQAVLGWIANNYELDHNPGMPEETKLQGLYYYYLTMARALNAWGSSSLEVNVEGNFTTVRANPGVLMRDVIAKINELSQAGHDDVRLAVGDDSIEGIQVTTGVGIETHDWANDMIDKITSLQAEDGSWANTESRWMEDNPILCTAYAVLALQSAID